MKNLLLFALLCSTFTFSQTEPFNYDLDWATFFYCPEGNNLSIAASAIDDEQNIYLAGGVVDSCEAFPNNDPLYNYHGMQDAYIAKFNTFGELLWFKYYGGSDPEHANSIKIVNNHIYLGGKISSTDSMLNFNNNLVGNSDGFVSKLTLDGEVLWSTYVGGDAEDSVDVIDVNNDDEIFVVGYSTSRSGLSTPHTFQPENIVTDTFRSGFIAKIDAQGNKVWASYYGEHKNGFLRSLAVGETGVYVMGIDMSFEEGNYYGTTGSHKESTGVDIDNFIAKFSLEGDRLWGTYFGGSLNESNIKPLTISTYGDRVYFCGYTASATDIATPGAQQESIGGSGSMFLTSMDADGNVVWSTYAGIKDPSIVSSQIGTSMNVDAYGNLYLSGITNLSGLATPDAYKSTITVGDHDAFVTKYNRNGEIVWGTYFGGALTDGGGQALVSADSFVFTGYSYNEGITTPGAFKETLNPNGSDYSDIIVRFGPPRLSIPEQNEGQFVVWPNPTNGHLTINATKEIKEVKIYDIVGKLILTTTFKNEKHTTLDLSGLMPGTYLLHAITEDEIQLQKIIKR